MQGGGGGSGSGVCLPCGDATPGTKLAWGLIGFAALASLFIWRVDPWARCGLKVSPPRRTEHGALTVARLAAEQRVALSLAPHGAHMVLLTCFSASTEPKCAWLR